MLYVCIYWVVLQWEYEDCLFIELKVNWLIMKCGFEDVLLCYFLLWNL